MRTTHLVLSQTHTPSTQNMVSLIICFSICNFLQTKFTRKAGTRIKSNIRTDIPLRVVTNKTILLLFFFILLLKVSLLDQLVHPIGRIPLSSIWQPGNRGLSNKALDKRKQKQKKYTTCHVRVHLPQVQLASLPCPLGPFVGGEQQGSEERANCPSRRCSES